MDSKSFGMKLRQCRVKCGLNREKCSEMAGITPRYLADIERGDKVPRLETLVLILNAVSASADFVLQDSLTAGCEPKSNELMKKLEALGPEQRKQTLLIFDSIVSVMDKF